MSDSLMSTCPGCGQTMIAGGERCDACAGAVYGGQERHEPMRLFAPASAPLAGQLTMSPEGQGSTHDVPRATRAEGRAPALGAARRQQG